MLPVLGDCRCLAVTYQRPATNLVGSARVSASEVAGITPESTMSVLEAGEADRTTTMSPLDEVVSPTSVESELMVTDMLDEHEAALNEHGKRKRDTDGEELTPRKLPSLTRNNNEVGFVLEGSPDDELREDRDDVSLSSAISSQ